MNGRQNTVKKNTQQFGNQGSPKVSKFISLGSMGKAVLSDNLSPGNSAHQSILAGESQTGAKGTSGLDSSGMAGRTNSSFRVDTKPTYSGYSPSFKILGQAQQIPTLISDFSARRR